MMSDITYSELPDGHSWKKIDRGYKCPEYQCQECSMIIIPVDADLGADNFAFYCHWVDEKVFNSTTYLGDPEGYFKILSCEKYLMQKALK